MKNLLPAFLLFLFGTVQSYAQCSATLSASNTSVCSGDSVYLTASPSGQQNYEWFVNGVSMGNLSYFYLSQNLSAGTYVFEVEITDNNSCVAMSAPLTVTVNQSPVITLSNNGPLCVGGNLQLSSSVTNATSYSWSGPNSFSSTSQNPNINNIQTNQAGWYYLSAVNGGCTVTIGTDVTVNGNSPSVVATADSSGSLCTGSYTIFNSVVTDLSGVTYSWTGPNSFTSNLPNPDIFNVSTLNAGVYTLTVTGQSCSGPVTLSDTALLTLVITPTITTATGPVPCVGGTIQLFGTVNAGTFHWSGPGFTSTQLNPTIPNAQLTYMGNYTLHADNNGCIANSIIFVSVNSNNPAVLASTSGVLCIYDSTFGIGASIDVSTFGMTGMAYSWTGPNSFTSTTAFNDLSFGTSSDAGTYTVAVTGTGCLGLTTVTSSVFVSGTACDSVWPGDTDNSFDVNNWDMFNIGIAYGMTGPARVGASNNWVAQYGTDWNSAFFNNQNHKFADCNGDGVVDGNDSTSILLNYGQWHNKGTHEPMAKSTGLPDLYFDMTGIVLSPGVTVTVPIKLGTTTVNMLNIYGIAASVKIQGIVPSSPMDIMSSGCMGNNTNSISIDRPISNSQTDWTLVRSDQNNISGDGTIALLTFTIPMGTDNQNVLLYFDNVKMVNNNGNEITGYNVLDENSTVFPVEVNNPISPASNAVIVPNPGDTYAGLQFSLNTKTNLSIDISDITGRIIWSLQQTYVPGQQTIILPCSEVASGMYNIQLRDDKGNVSQNLKWIKK